MKVAVFGLWHLGSVTAACLADSGHDVIGIDENLQIIEKLTAGMAPLFEPDLDDLIKRGIEGKKLKFSELKAESFADAQVVWVTYDTPVDDEDTADVEYVINKIICILPYLSIDTVILVSSQLPVGSIRGLESYAKENHSPLQLRFACSPENLRLGQAIKVFTNPDRIIVGVRDQESKNMLMELIHPVSKKIEWMSTESAEMTKHAINAFLATSITFTNEIASICEAVGANAKEVERGLKTESRIGPRAYVSPGGPFAGGTLARDIAFLGTVAADNDLVTPVLSSVRLSNDEHKNWAKRKLLQHFGDLHNKTIAVWGLTYKPGTNTLRRSLAVELCNWIMAQGGDINVYDPVVEELPKRWENGVTRYFSGRDALRNADALVVATEWPELKGAALEIALTDVYALIIVDANGFLKDTLGDKAMKYYVVGEQILDEDA
ncbi:nucleotide sugar dehydrogenase [Pseudomonadales bacterium]|nr:nucleotide sugar dehydrogenase [Pseudomonadales bacterium]